MQRFAENWRLPVGNGFRFQDTFDNHHPLYAGDVASTAPLWAADDAAITAPGGAFNSLQFQAGLRYANASTGLLHFPANCGGTWHCDALVDWPAGTRDGYDCGTGNSADTVRSALGALAFDALASLASWGGRPAAPAADQSHPR